MFVCYKSGFMINIEIKVQCNKNFMFQTVAFEDFFSNYIKKKKNIFLSILT